MIGTRESESVRERESERERERERETERERQRKGVSAIVTTEFVILTSLYIPRQQTFL